MTASTFTADDATDTLARPAARTSGQLGTALTRAATAIERVLDALLPPPAGPEARLARAMRYAALGGGKRLRGFLVLESAALFGADPQGALRVAAAIEMLHAYSLVHDDLPAMDDDDLRRGQPSCHRAFDEATAILAGDALQTRAFEVLVESSTHPDPAIRCELARALATASGAAGMAGGQMIDMATEGQTLTLAEALHLQALKTGRLLQFAAEAGAILGGASPARRADLAEYGRELGAAFQIADDLLDASGSTDQIGKTAGKDQAAGKATIVSLLGLDAAAQEADRLARSAQARLTPFAARGECLRALAAHVVSRRS